MSYRDRSPKPQLKASPMFSPSINGVGALSSRGVPPSPLSKGLDGAFGSSSSPSVNYDDVFGGPPRFATSVFVSDSGLSSSAMLDRVSARTPSFRPSSSSMFELPVFGDDVFRSGSSAHESRPASVSYEDIFREDVHTLDVFPATTMYGSSLSGISRSRPSSRCSSRCMSPAHPASSIPGQIGEDDFFKHRGKPLESPFTISRSNTAMATASLPSSPPKVENWSNLKKFSGSNSAKSLTSPPIVDNDDVFGGFPQRSFPQPFTAVQYDGKDAMEAMGMREKSFRNKVAVGNKVPSSPSVGRTLIYSEGPSVAIGNKVPSSPSAGRTLIYSEGLSCSLSTSSSSNDEQGQQDDFIEIRMDKRRDSSISEKGESMAEKVWVTVNDLRQSTQPPQRWPLSRPPPVPAAQLKYKSWKDWASDLPASAASSGSKLDATVAVPALLSTPFSEQKDLNNGETISKFVKDWVENVPSKQIEDSMSLHQGLGKHTGSAPFRSKVNKKVAEESVELEERELQAILTNAWRLNEKREREKAATNKPRIQEAPAKSKSKGQEPQLEEETMSLDEQSKPSPSQHSKDVVEGKNKQSIESQPQLSRHILDERVRQSKTAQPQQSGHNSKQRVRQSKVSQPQESTHYNEDKVRQSKVSQSQQSTLYDEDKMTSAHKVPPPQQTGHHDVDQAKLDDAGQEFKGGNEQAKTFQHAQSSTYNGDADLHWKAWRNKERKQSTKKGVDVPENTTTEVPSSCAQEPVVETTGASLEPNGVLEPEDLFDPEVIVQVVMEEVPTNCSVVSKSVPEKGADVDLRTKSIESGNGNALCASKGQLQSESGIASTLHASGGPEKDVVQCTDEQVDLSQSEGGEELDCLLGLDPSSLDGFQEIEGESLERRKARWERHLRARERGAKALNEMQKRDAEVQRQQAEKQQLAEMSDRQIKRWAAGKEGNLRALLSNLQHVLWPESGWQPIGLTDLIEGPDVKKAYRKATLFFHPDKMQQKGATLQQKYIAERVFDILQEAWKTFNMQELF